MFKQLRSHSLSLQLLLPVIAFLPYLIFIFLKDLPEATTHNAQGWIYHSYLVGINQRPWLFMIFGWALNLFTAFSLYWLNIRFEIIGKRTVYVSYLFCLLALTPLGFHSFHPGMLGGLSLFISLIFLFLIYHKSQTQAYLFNAGLFWGISVIVYPPFLAMLPLYVLGTRFVKNARGKDFILLFAGLLTPVWLWLGICYLQGNLRFQWLSLIQWSEIRHTWPPELPGQHILWYAFSGFLFLVLIMNINQYRVKKDGGRRVLIILSQLMWLSLLIFLLFERVSIEIFWVTMVSTSLLLSLAAFNSRQTWISDLVFICLIGFLILFQLKLFL